MNVKIKYFASMRDRMGRGEDMLQFDRDQVTVAEVWEKIGAQEHLPNNTLIAVNQEYTDKSQVLRHGDEIAFFPPVTGG